MLLDKNTSGGITFKFAKSDIAETASANAYAIDIGGKYQISNNMALSLSGQNIGITTKFLYRKENLPLFINGAMGYGGKLGSIEKNLYYIIGIDSQYILNEDRVISSMGIEIGYNPIGFFLGYEFSAEENNLNIGFIVSGESFDISYSYYPSRWLYPIHQFSVGFSFGSGNLQPGL